MDTSDSDDEWVLEEQDIIEESEWEASRKRLKPKKKNSKTNDHPGSVNQLSFSNEDGKGNEFTSEFQNTVTEICCTCSKGSLCKTMRCECQAKSGFCNKACKCSSSKCSNRERTECDTRDTSQNLVSQGALLLHSALCEKPIEINDENEPKRKALADISNTQAKSNAPTNQRTKWKNPKFQLVILDTPPQPETTESRIKPEGATKDIKIPLQLPREIRSIPTINNPLEEINYGHQDDTSVNKGTRTPTPTSPQWEGEIRDEKENRGL